MGKKILKVKRAICATIGHDWGPWERDWTLPRRTFFRTCKRCPAYELDDA